MADKRKSSLISAIMNLVFLVPSLFSLARNVLALIGLEARLAGKHLIVIIVLSFILAAILTSTWFCTLALVVVYLVSINWSWAQAIMAVIILNLVLFIIIGIAINNAKENLLFPATRRKLRRFQRQDDDDD